MKVVDKIYMPVKLGKNKTLEYCVDGKNHPRMYKSFESLEKHMKERFDYVAVYSTTNVLSPIFLRLQEV